MAQLQADDGLMLVLQWIAITLLIISLLAILDLALAWFRLTTHPHIDPIEVAKPEIAFELNQLVAEVAAAAAISPPPIYIRRAAMPNAFVMAAISRPELYLTDELLEHCDNSLEELTRVICHEVSHIQRGDAFKLGFLTYGAQWSSRLSLKWLKTIFQSAIDRIEQETDARGEQLVARLNR